MRRAAILAFFAASVAVGATLIVIDAGLSQVPSLTKKVEVDRGYFYRLIVNLAYKGEPLTFNIVVGCNVRTTIYKYNDRTVEMGVMPMAYGLRMKNGRGVVVRPPEACKGETTENGRVPATILPLVVTYENADEPWFGLAYASDDAYDSPRSELKFFNATISHATRPEWEEWRHSEAPKNFVTYELLGMNPDEPFNPPRWERGRHFMAFDCQGFARLALPALAREIVRNHWPPGHPEYWYADNATEVSLRRISDRKTDPPSYDGYRLVQYLSKSVGSSGVPRRAPGGLIFYTNTVAGPIYPARSDLTVSHLEPNGDFPANVLAKPKLVWAAAQVAPDLQGFGYCDRVRNIPNLPFDSRGPGAQYVNEVNGQPIDESLHRPVNVPNFVFERDEYLLLIRIYTLMNIFGGL